MPPPIAVPFTATSAERAPRKREISSTATMVPQIGIAIFSSVPSEALLRSEQLQPLRLDLREPGGNAADVTGDDSPQYEQPGQDGDALDDIGDRIRQQSADDRIGGHQHGRQQDRRLEAHPGVLIHHLPEGAHLRRRPDDRAWQQHDDHQPLHACRVALAKQVRKRCEPRLHKARAKKTPTMMMAAA